MGHILRRFQRHCKRSISKKSFQTLKLMQKSRMYESPIRNKHKFSRPDASSCFRLQSGSVPHGDRVWKPAQLNSPVGRRDPLKTPQHLVSESFLLTSRCSQDDHKASAPQELTGPAERQNKHIFCICPTPLHPRSRVSVDPMKWACYSKGVGCLQTLLRDRSHMCLDFLAQNVVFSSASCRPVLRYQPIRLMAFLFNLHFRSQMFAPWSNSLGSDHTSTSEPDLLETAVPQISVNSEFDHFLDPSQDFQ